MKKVIFIIIFFLGLQLNAKEKSTSGFYIGTDFTLKAKGNKSYGSSYDDLDRAFDYTTSGVQYKLGYGFKDVLRLEYGYSRYYAKEYKNFSMHTLTAVLFTKFISTGYWFNADYNLYPAYELGFFGDYMNMGTSLNFEYNKRFIFIVAYRVLLEGLGMGGGGNSVEGYYLGWRYKF